VVTLLDNPFMFPGCSLLITFLTVSSPHTASLPLSEDHYNITSLNHDIAIFASMVMKFCKELV
jgi:hypothetical protein